MFVIPFEEDIIEALAFPNFSVAAECAASNRHVSIPAPVIELC